MEILPHAVGVEDSRIRRQGAVRQDRAAGEQNLAVFIPGGYLQPHLADIRQGGGEVVAGTDIFHPDFHLGQFPVAIDRGDFQVRGTLQPLHRHVVLGHETPGQGVVAALLGRLRPQVGEEVVGAVEIVAVVSPRRLPEGIRHLLEHLYVDHVAVLAEDVRLGVGAALPFVVGGLQGEVGVVVVNLVTGGAEIGLEAEGGLFALVETAAALLARFERRPLHRLAVLARLQDQGAVLRVAAGGLLVGDAADGVADVAGDAGKGHGGEPGQAGTLDLAGDHAGWGVAPLALAGDVVPHRLDRLVQFTLVNRINKRQVVHRAVPFAVLLHVALAALLRRGEGDIALFPLDQ